MEGVFDLDSHDSRQRPEDEGAQHLNTYANQTVRSPSAKLYFYYHHLHCYLLI